MTKIITIVVMQFAQLASFLGLYFTVLPPGAARPQWHWLLLAIAVGIFAYIALREIKDFITNAPKTYKNANQINQFMFKWVSAGGRIAIFSRDMSWANEERIKKLLLDKATRNELTLYVEHSTALVKDLVNHGANVIVYGSLRFVPRSRFTIIDFERDGASVAVGAKQNGRHVIQIFRNGEHPFFAVAEDMIRLVSSIIKREQSDA